MSIAARVIVCDTSVDVAEPAIPILGNGPMPMIRIGLSTMSSPTCSRAK